VEIDSRGDKVFVITGTYNGLDVVGELRMYAEMDLMRWHWTFTNNDNAAINNTNVELANGDSQDYYGDGTTSDNDQLWETTDWYGTMFDAGDTTDDGDRSAIATAFVGGNGEIEVSSVEENDVIDDGEELQLDYDFDVAAGESKELIWFLSSSDYTAGEDPIASNSVDPLVAGFGDGVVQGRFARGLVDNNNSNWETIIPEAANLADTGADTSTLWAGLGLLVAGVAVVAVRRRSRA
jgi:LPXTG-motif cell wall-anchored protein